MRRFGPGKPGEWMAEITTGEVLTNDGITLRYLEAGEGDPLVMIPGYACTATGFEAQLAGLSDQWRVIALNMRGHGTSDKPSYGYRIARFAADVRDALVGLDLTNVALLGHSLGCQVVWSYLDLFNSDQVSRIVLVDQPPVMMRNPAWSEDELRKAGAPLTPAQVVQSTNASSEDFQGFIEGAFGKMLTDSCSEAVREKLFREASTLDPPNASHLMLDQATTDLRDVLSRVSQPTLYIGGRYKTVGRSAQRWICEQIPDVRHVVFEVDEGGSHFLHLENPERFNAEIADFLIATA